MNDVRRASFLALTTVSILFALTGSVRAGEECAGQPVDTPCTADANDCTRDVCDGTGACVHLHSVFRSACTDDGSECTEDFCNGGGACIHPPLPFRSPCSSDGNECTADFCDGGSMCLHQNLPFRTPCNDDGNECTADFCDGGNVCVHQSLPFHSPCSDDGNQCTADFCDGGNVCLHVNVPHQSSCQDDGIACTRDICDGSGTCIHTGPATCGSGCAGEPDGTSCADDGNPCTADVCSSNTCQHLNVPQNTPCTSDGNECTDDVCDFAGVCQHFNLPANVPCNSDGKICTTDVCDSMAVCQHFSLAQGIPCETDNNECTDDVCDTMGVCQHFNLAQGTPCDDDENECTLNRCNNTAGCDAIELVQTPCQDEVDACTTDVCSGGSCEHFTRSGCVTPPQTKAQQKCLMALNKRSSLLFKVASKASVTCASAALNGKEPSPQACLTADAKGKIADVQDKLNEAAGKLCTAGALPDFGPSSAAVATAAVEAERLALVADLFGENLDTALLPPDTEQRIKCQDAVHKAARGLASGEIKSFVTCKKKGIKEEIVSRLGLDQCLEQGGTQITDPASKLGKLVAKLTKALQDCSFNDTAEAFPGACVDSVSAAAFQACVLSSVQCRVCRVLASLDDLAVSCDLFDDGQVNESCEQP
ncbi:MAG TPA: hypothetical protein VEL28_05605 [Candidatus Binatia bacterium]|nr:hypothetical protein [Candidatus Binatia bacterium]